MTDKTNDMFHRSLLTKVAWLYYIEGMTQKDIGEQLGITRIKVIKMIEEAKHQHIIQFKIPISDREKIETEVAIKEKYQLNDVFVVPTEKESNTNNSIAQAAAIYIDNLIEKDAYINVGYGDTVGKVLNHLATLSEKNISFISMTGGVSPYLPNNKSNVFKAKLFLVPSPLIMNSKETAQNILLEKAVKEIMNMTSLANISVVGIGGVGNESTIVRTNIITNNDFIKLQMKGAVGDILMHFIDNQGNLIKSDIESKLISTSLDKLKKFNNVIAVAAGESKVAAIKASLLGGYINTLITDQKTAEGLLQN